MATVTIAPIRKGLHRIVGLACACGGELRVERCKDDGTPLSDDPEFRWETFCVVCKTCDPDGWATMNEALANAPRCFGRK